MARVVGQRDPVAGFGDVQPPVAAGLEASGVPGGVLPDGPLDVTELDLG